MDSAPLTLVVAGVLIERREGSARVLITQRKKGAHLEGLWELPGGKIDPGEDPRDALVRELDEELGIAVDVGPPVEVTPWKYPGRHVLLLFFECARRAGSPEPRPLDVADLRWADRDALAGLEFPPADVAVVTTIRARLAALDAANLGAIGSRLT